MVKTAFTKGSTPLPHQHRFRSMVRVLPDGDPPGGPYGLGAPYLMAVSGAARGNATVMAMDLGWLDCREQIAMDVLYKVAP